MYILVGDHHLLYLWYSSLLALSHSYWRNIVKNIQVPLLESLLRHVQQQEEGKEEVQDQHQSSTIRSQTRTPTISQVQRQPQCWGQAMILLKDVGLATQHIVGKLGLVCLACGASVKKFKFSPLAIDCLTYGASVALG